MCMSILRQLFPYQQALRDWVQGTGELPAAIPELGVRYLLTGQVRLQDQEGQVTVELLDRATGHRLPGTLTVDFPRLETLRTGFMALLAQAGLPVPASQQPKVLWPEDLSLTVFTRLGQGLYTLFSAFSNGEQTVSHPQPFAEAMQHAPHSYLVLNIVGGVAALQQRYTEAVRLFEQALAINPVGVDAADGMRQSGIATGNEALEESWTIHKARMQGKDVQRALAQMWTQRGKKFSQNGDYPHAIVAWEQALAIQREFKNRAGEGTILNKLSLAYDALRQYERAIGYYEQALAIQRGVKNRLGEGPTLNNFMMTSKARQAPRLAIFYGKQAVNVYQAIRGDIQTLDKALQQSFLTSKAGTYRTLADLLITTGRLPEESSKPP